MMSEQEIRSFLIACAQTNAEVVAASKLVVQPYKKSSGEHLKGPRAPRRVAVGRGVCSYCREVRIVHLVHHRLCCRECAA